MKPLEPWRSELRSLIPRGFIRRDQGEGLFVSDYPRRGEEAAVSAALRAVGYTVAVADGLAFIDSEPAKYRALLENLPAADIPPVRDDTLYLHALALRLVRAQTPLERQPIAPVRLVLKCLDGGDLKEVERLLPPMLALLQRRGEPLPSAAGALIFQALSEREKEEHPC